MIAIKEMDKTPAVYLELESLADYELEQLKSLFFALTHASITNDACTYDPERLTYSLFLAQDFIEAIQEKVKKLSDLALTEKRKLSKFEEKEVKAA